MYRGVMLRKSIADVMFDFKLLMEKSTEGQKKLEHMQ